VIYTIVTNTAKCYLNRNAFNNRVLGTGNKRKNNAGKLLQCGASTVIPESVRKLEMQKDKWATKRKLRYLLYLSITALTLLCTPRYITRSENKVPSISLVFNSDDPVIDSIGQTDLDAYLSARAKQLKIEYVKNDIPGVLYRINVSAKKPELVDSVRQAELFYKIYQILQGVKEPYIPPVGAQVAINVAVNALTLPFGRFMLIGFEPPNSMLSPADSIKIDSLIPKSSIYYTITLSHTEKGTVWSHDTTIMTRLPKYTPEKEQQMRCTSAMLNDIRDLVPRVVR
jgi:hypothetical protein